MKRGMDLVSALILGYLFVLFGGVVFVATAAVGTVLASMVK